MTAIAVTNAASRQATAQARTARMISAAATEVEENRLRPKKAKSVRSRPGLGIQPIWSAA
jgi:hypothetical protein